jgi:hypothetical protein
VRASRLLQTSDECLALDFDLKCTDRLVEYDNEREARLLEALTAGAAMNTLSQLMPHK